MKKIYSTISMLLLPIMLMAQGIEFEKGTLKEALEKAKQENKLLFIDGYAVWCGPCKKMDKTVFKEAEVGAYFKENLVALKVDVEKGEGPAIKEKYEIHGLPGYVFIDGEGEVVYRLSGFMPTEKFLEEVKLAVKYFKDPQSVGRLAGQYEKKKEDEGFLKLYLDKLKASNMTGYSEILEQYLRVQKSHKESSKEMVLLLADHHKEIVIGGEAYQIYLDNMGTDEWKKYVRKDIREIYLNLPKMAINQTTEYAISKKDTTYLELALEEAVRIGQKVGKAQRDRVYTYYYLNAKLGEKYKAMVYGGNDAFVKSLDVEKLRANYIDVTTRQQQGDKDVMGVRPFSVGKSQQISGMVKAYAEFATTEKDKEDVLRWMEVAYYITPGTYLTMSDYANILYMFGDNKEEALKIKSEAYELAVKEHYKRVDTIKAELEAMKEGEEITL
ncbi:thioredoxin family protein [Limibacter armeniacum]|uniref:thioredoxin family protein n=1 Tax=Limibacter armeniacum TaxID=466084 RepID=UPI002FE5757D